MTMSKEEIEGLRNFRQWVVVVNRVDEAEEDMEEAKYALEEAYRVKAEVAATHVGKASSNAYDLLCGGSEEFKEVFIEYDGSPTSTKYLAKLDKILEKYND